MEPNFDRTPGLIRPQSSTEKLPLTEAGPDFSRGSETPVSNQETFITPPGAPASATDNSNFPEPFTGSLTQSSDAQATTTTTAASKADDNNKDDKLDREWVDKAKAIVERTKDDPFVESREIGKVKAGYMSVRYNKQIKLAEDKST